MQFSKISEDGKMGELAEKRVAQYLECDYDSISVKCETEQHSGDLIYQDIYIEVKHDAMSSESGNLCFEFADKPLGETILLTGVLKHATQKHFCLMVHEFYNKGEMNYFIYDPVEIVLWLQHDRKRSLIVRKETRSWNNRGGYGTKTIGFLIPSRRLNNLPGVICSTNEIKNIVDTWKCKIPSPLNHDEVISIFQNTLLRYHVNKADVFQNYRYIKIKGDSPNV